MSTNLNSLLQKPRTEISVDTPKRNKFLRDGLENTSKENILGRGSYGIVIKAVYKGKPVAVKVIDHLSESKQATIDSEANVLGWEHENIIKVYKIVPAQGYSLVIMECFPGQCLQHVLNSIRVPFYHAIRISLDITKALVFCHEHQLVHLDIKPKNIIIAFSTENTYCCKLCDFGSSHLLNDSHPKNMYIRGTVRYMAPETLQNSVVTFSSDIYSVGIAMWQIRTGENPYSALNKNDIVAYKVVKENLRPDSTKNILSPRLQDICLCSHLNSNRCHSSIEDVQNYLKHKTASPFKSAKRVIFGNLNKSLNITSQNNLQKSPITFQRRNLNASRSPNKPKINVQIYVDPPSISDCVEEFQLKKIFASKYCKNVVEAKRKYQDLYQKCWDDQPSRRPSAVDLQNNLEEILMYF